MPSFIYENILSHAQDYIKANAPVTELILSRNADKDGKDMYNPKEPNILFLSGRSVRRAPYLGHSDYISSHPISEMLRYILKTEGWIQYSDHEYHLFLPRKGVICDI